MKASLTRGALEFTSFKTVDNDNVNWHRRLLNRISMDLVGFHCTHFL